ncbi:hypothetical protein ASG84_19005 [Rhodococcus sp. Leaf278]|uniref:hypothetical protein n=1 Tax=Rhodococcus sp. Leaf278 TaxID=1736319 RepID=UPI00070C1FC5|nr:hypothetical protein [Rhodococcus sp. Leaf278]KQU56720.1 hypothetical protein ASG84_19005 [Rhodococcus sp. Leaf278]
MTEAVSDAAFVAIAQATKHSIGLRVCGKEPSELEPVDVTVFTQRSWIGTESGYAVEIMPQLATEDQPATVEACDRLAADILGDVAAVVPHGAPFHVWVNNGGMTGFAEGFGTSSSPILTRSSYVTVLGHTVTDKEWESACALAEEKGQWALLQHPESVYRTLAD